MQAPRPHYEHVQALLRARPRTWLLTGVAVFIGSHLLHTLLELNQRVVGLDNFSTGHHSNLDEVRSLLSPTQWARFDFIEGDIRDLPDCLRACQGVDHVLHQAALGSPQHSGDDPIACNDVNVSGFLNMLVAARDCRVTSFTYASSNAVYGEHIDLPLPEQHTGRPLSVFGASKLSNEQYAQVFAHQHDLACTGLRYFDVFGPRQDPNGAYAAVIPKWIASMIKSDPIYINGDGETSRDFCFIANVVQANLLAATTQNPEAVNQVYNVAVGDRTTLNQLYEQLHLNLLPSYPHLRGVQPVYRDFRAGDVRHSLADISKAATLLGYQPTHRIGEGLKVAMEWYVSCVSA